VAAGLDFFTTPAKKNEMAVKPLWPEFVYKPHQTIGIEWMLERETQMPAGGIVCDEMGLGKTIEMLGLIKSSVKKVSHNLILAPVAVLNQWADASKKAAMTVYRPKITQKHVSWELDGSNRFLAHKVYLIGYEAGRSRHDLLTAFPWDRVICDEAHRLASGNTSFTLVNGLVSKARWLLTATPIVNGLDDLTHLFELLGLDEPKLITHDYEKLSKAVNTYVLARSMDQLRASIVDAPPAPEIQTQSLAFDTAEEGEFYKGISGVIVKKWKAVEADGAGALKKLQLFMKLRQLSLHPQVYIDARKKALGSKYSREDWNGSSTKFEAIRSTIEGQIGNSGAPHKWIIFCHFHPEMQLLESMLKAQLWCRSVSIYSGVLNHKERAAMIEKTHLPLPSSKQTDVLLVQLQSGGTGLNLQHFDRIIFTGPWWTSALMEQAIGRAVRIGQKEIVKVYNFVLQEEEAINIDRVMRAKAEEKGSLCRQVLELATRSC
jgi:SNF2 family DNA or RNA helicase